MGSKEEWSDPVRRSETIIDCGYKLSTTGQKLKHNYLCADIYFDKTDSPIILQL